MKKQERNKGITMITLIVTVIVLLIISAITIKTLTGKKGLLSNTRDSKNLSNSAEELEILNTSVAAAMGASSKAKVEETNLRYFLNQNIGDENKNYTLKIDKEIGTYFYVTFLKTKNEYTVTEEGEILTGTIKEDEKLKLEPTTLVLTKGETYNLKLETNAKGEIEWASKDESIVKVTANASNQKEATINAIEVGEPIEVTATITTNSGKKVTATCSITVVKNKTNVALTITEELMVYNATLGEAPMIYQIDAVGINGVNMYSNVAKISFTAPGKKSTTISFEAEEGATITVTKIYGGNSDTIMGAATQVFVVEPTSPSDETITKEIDFQSVYDDGLNYINSNNIIYTKKSDSQMEVKYE